MSQSDGIVAKDLLVGFGLTKPVCQVEQLVLKRNSITVLCGPNGAGKSTILKTIAQQIPALVGDITIDGVNVREINRSQLAQQLAYVPQFADSRRSLTVEEWVSLGRNPHQKWWSWQVSADDREKIDSALQRTACESFRDKSVETLSGGERQRVLIATALAQEPKYMLLDEPTAHLDFRHQLELLDLLKSLRNEGLGILLVLHDLNLTARIADTVLMLQRTGRAPGRLIAAGPVETVFSPEIFAQVYGVEMEIVSNADRSLTSYVARKLCT